MRHYPRRRVVVSVSAFTLGMSSTTGGRGGAQRVGVGTGADVGRRRRLTAGDRRYGWGSIAGRWRGCLVADEPPRYSRAPTGSMLDPLERVLCRLFEEWPEIKAPRVTEILREDHGYTARSTWFASGWRGCGRGRCGRRSGPVIGRGRCCSWTGPRCRHARGSPAASGASTRWLPRCPTRRADRALQLRPDHESFLEGHVRIFDWLGGDARVCLRQPALGGRAPRSRPGHLESAVPALRGRYAFHATACTPATPREKGSSRAASGI